MTCRSRSAALTAVLLPVALALSDPIGAGVANAPAGSRDVDAQALGRLQRPPLGLPDVPVPGDNPPSVEKIALGRKLFFDRRLSFNGTMSCGMCHVPEQGFTNNELATPLGVEGRSLKRNAPTILNAGYVENIFHDGRDISLETQIINPILARNEMANPSIGWLLRRIASLEDYDELFERAFGGGPTIDRIGKAIATWERTLLLGDSPFDRWRYGNDRTALSDLQRRGFDLFVGRGGCVRCHVIGERSALFTDEEFHDTGIGYHVVLASRDDSPVIVELAPGMAVPMDRALVRSVGEAPQPDLGRYEITLDEADKWRFRTPSLRNVALTGPYMHNGSLRTLDDVVRFYSKGGIRHAGLDSLILPLHLDETEITALVSFLESLTGAGADDLVADARSVAVGD